MNIKPYFLIFYHIFFLITFMGIVTLIRGYGTEMFAYALYFNLVYLIFGFLFNYLLYLLAHYFFNNKKTFFLVVIFLLFLFFMNLLGFFLNNAWVSYNLIKEIFRINHSDTFRVALTVHITMIISFLLAYISTLKKMKTIKQTEVYR